MLHPAPYHAATSPDQRLRPTPRGAVALAFATLFTCTISYGQQAVKRPPLLPAAQPTTAQPEIDLFDFIIDQKKCALYVAVRSGAFQTPLAFGQEFDGAMVRWNKCPGGEMVACTVAPQPNGDTIITGIPWRH